MPSPSLVNDLDRITSEALGMSIDLKEDPKHLRAKIAYLVPLSKDPLTGKTVIGERRGMLGLDVTQSTWPMVGPVAVPAAALHALSRYADDSLGEIKPFDCAAGDGCSFEPIAALIRTHIRSLDAQFASGHPLEPEVNALTDALMSYVEELGKRCGIDIDKACTIEHEKIVTRFIGLQALAQHFRDKWDEAIKTGDGKYFLLTAQDIHRHLFAIVTSLDRLHELVPDADFVTTEIPTMTGVEVGPFVHWMRQYAETTAPQILREGRDGVPSIHATMKRFFDGVDHLIVGDGAAAATATTEDPCAGVMSAFEDEDVQDVLEDLRCHVARILDLTKSVV
jgi:hypothetical protein